MEFNATFFVSVISFLMFVFIMNKIFYAPLTKIIGQRKELLDANYNDAKQLNDNADSILRERDERMSDVEHKSRKLISDKIEAENLKAKDLTSQAVKKSSAEIQAQKNELLKDKEEAMPVLDSKILGLAESISSKVLGMDVKIQDANILEGVK